MSPEALLAAEDIAAILSLSTRYVLETISLTLGFPAAIRLELPSNIEGKDGKIDKSKGEGAAAGAEVILRAGLTH